MIRYYETLEDLHFLSLVAWNAQHLPLLFAESTPTLLGISGGRQCPLVTCPATRWYAACAAFSTHVTTDQHRRQGGGENEWC